MFVNLSRKDTLYEKEIFSIFASLSLSPDNVNNIDLNGNSIIRILETPSKLQEILEDKYCATVEGLF